jgi:endoglucanase
VPPTSAATLNLAAAAAQGARVLGKYDRAFANRLLAAAEVAWQAAHVNPVILQPPGGVGGGAYDDQVVADEFYWAAAELYLTTGKLQYRDFILGSPVHRSDVFSVDGFDWGTSRRWPASSWRPCRTSCLTCPGSGPRWSRVPTSTSRH